MAMEPRQLRMVAMTERPRGVCERCGMSFTSGASRTTVQQDEIREAFDRHKCVPSKSSALSDDTVPTEDV